MNKNYYFISYSICGSKGIDVKNAVTDLHPFEWIAALNHTFDNLPLIIKVSAAIVTWREISEKEYTLFQN
jgi:hypothetical protein